MTAVYDALVVGSGPAGSATAAALAAAGRTVVLLEASRHPRPKACAEYASPMIADELERLGLQPDAWQTDAVAVSGMRVIRGKDAVDVRYADARGRRPAWGLDRTRFDATLATHAAERGANVLQHTSFVSAQRSNGIWQARVRDASGEDVVHARWLIGADGARSRVAHRLGVERAVRMPRRLGLVAHYEGHPELLDRGEMHVAAHHYVGLAPLAGGRLNVGMALPARVRGGGAEERFEAAIAALPAVAARLAGRRRLTPIRGASPIGHRVARTAGPGWLLVGDAAGFIDPFTGEGIFRALRSARAAATALASPDEDAEARYLAERRAAFSAKDALTWTIQGLLAAPPVLGYALRRLGARDGLALRLGSALGDCRPASDALSPLFLARVLRP